MNAIGYIRISVADQSHYSLPDQERTINEYCTRNNLNLIGIYKDDGESSYTFDRPDFKALETFIKNNRNIQYLVVKDNDRFSRNLAEALLKIKELEIKYRIKVVATTDPFDTDFTDPNNFIVRAFKYMMAESELHRIRQRTKNGLYQAASMGRHVNKAPFGYINAKDTEGKAILTIDEEKAFAIRVIFREFISGTGIEEVRRIAKNFGYNQTSNSAIQRVLSNPLYAGMIKLPARNKQPEKLIKAIHAPLVSEQDYWTAQDKLNNKGIAVQNREEVPLRGALHCWCGKLVTAGNSKSKSGKYYWYYLCKEHKNNLSANKLHAQFNDMLDTMSLDAGTLSWFKDKLSEKLGAFIDTRGSQIKELTKKIKSLELQITSTEEKFLVQPDISKATYNKVISKQRADLVQLQSSLASLNTNQQVYWDKLNMLLPKLSNLRSSFEAMDLNKKHRFIDTVFDRQLSHDGETYRTPFLLELFSDKELVLKEKRLLIKEQPVLNLGETPVRTESGNPVEHLAALADLFAA